MPLPRRPPTIESPSLLARFPFLPQGEDWLKGLLLDNGIELDTLIEGEWVEPIRIRGTQRMLQSIQLDEGVDSVTRHDIHESYGQMVEGLGFYYAMLVVCSSFDERLVKRWVEGEASRADKILGELTDNETFELVAKTYLSDIRIKTEETAGISIHTRRTTKIVYEIPMLDFIEISPRITGHYWNLVNRPILDGWVTMDEASGENSQQRLARLIKERIREVLVDRCKINMDKMDDEFTAKFADPVGKMVAELQLQKSHDIEISAVHQGDWPPCMTSVISDLAQGENVNHAGRRFLANMCRSLALSVEEAQSFFVNAPDYNEGTTRYQLGHLYEGEYTPEKCLTLKLHARCPIDQGLVTERLCGFEWLTHPLKFVRAKQRRRARDEPLQPVAEVQENASTPSPVLSQDNDS
jgi:DNA primase large subunit